jgi:subtilisin family serine protease
MAHRGHRGWVPRQQPRWQLFVLAAAVAVLLTAHGATAPMTPDAAVIHLRKTTLHVHRHTGPGPGNPHVDAGVGPAWSDIAGGDQWLVAVAPSHMADITGETLHLLHLTGAVLCGYVAHHAYLVFANATSVALLSQLPFVHDVLHVDPTHRVAPELDAACRGAAEPLRVVLLTPAVPGLRVHDLATAARRLLGSNASVLRVSSATGTGFEPSARRGKLELLLHTSPCDSLTALSRQPWVQWLEPAPSVAARNLFAVEAVLSDAWSQCDASSLPSRDGAALGADPALQQRPLWAAGLTGRGQVIGLGDTGLDLQSCFFSDLAPNGTFMPPGPWHRKVLAYNSAFGDAVDGNGHGTHVAGTLAGSAQQGSPWEGLAKGARLVVHDLGIGATGQLHLPDDLSLYYSFAYRLGARVHSDSWGGSTPSYDALAQETDAFCWEHDSFLPVFAAGNFGVVANPATSKNALAVGAVVAATSAGPVSPSEATSADASAESVLIYDVVAPFSATGPTADGRLKPDVVAPGETRSAAPAPGGGPGCYTETSRGTSMAAPVAAGAATLVRQYFVDGFHPSGKPSPEDALQPSSALLKAVIVNGADVLPGVDAALQGHGRLHLGSRTLPLHSNDTLEWRPRMFVIDRRAVATGQVHRYCVRVTAGSSGVMAIASADAPPRLATPAQQLRVTLAWTDPPVLPSVGGPVLVNDLDLRVTPLTADSLETEATPSTANRVDNVERMVLDLRPRTAAFMLEVDGHRVAWPHAAHGGQPYALVATGPGLTGTRFTDAASCAVMMPPNPI